MKPHQSNRQHESARDQRLTRQRKNAKSELARGIMEPSSSTIRNTNGKHKTR